MATLRTLDPVQNPLEVRTLPSTGVTRFRRYYEPVRHPTRPDLSLAGFRLGDVSHRWGFPCCARSPCTDMPPPFPRWDHGKGDCGSPSQNPRLPPSPSLTCFA